MTFRQACVIPPAYRVFPRPLLLCAQGGAGIDTGWRRAAGIQAATRATEPSTPGTARNDTGSPGFTP